MEFRIVMETELRMLLRDFADKIVDAERRILIVMPNEKDAN